MPECTNTGTIQHVTRLHLAHHTLRGSRHDPVEHVGELVGRDRRWMAYAEKIARGLDSRWRVACVIVKNGRVLAVAACQERNDPRCCHDRLWMSSEHAEAGALRLAGPSARGAVAYVARVGRDGKVRHAQPCRRCRAALEAAGCRYLWTSDPTYAGDPRETA